jgi:hypothetical protein
MESRLEQSWMLCNVVCPDRVSGELVDKFINFINLIGNLPFLAG